MVRKVEYGKCAWAKHWHIIYLILAWLSNGTTFKTIGRHQEIDDIEPFPISILNAYLDRSRCADHPGILQFHPRTFLRIFRTVRKIVPSKTLWETMSIFGN